MNIISLKKDDDILEFIKKVVKENSDCKIYLTGDVARKFLNYARNKKADTNKDEKIGEKAILRHYCFDDGMGDIDEIKIKDDLDDRNKFQIISFSSTTNGVHFTYTFTRNCERKLVQSDEIIISDRPYVRERGC